MTTRQCTRCQKNRQERFYVSARGRVCVDCQRTGRRKSARNAHVTNTYGITADEYDELLAAQGGVCAGCKGERPYNLAVDHDHALEALWGIRKSVRALLCKRCNGVLKDVRDNVDILRGLIAVLLDPPARKVLK